VHCLLFFGSTNANGHSIGGLNVGGTGLRMGRGRAPHSLAVNAVKLPGILLHLIAERLDFLGRRGNSLLELHIGSGRSRGGAFLSVLCS